MNKIISHTYQPSPTTKPIKDDKPTLHRLQRRAIDALKDQPYVILNAPTGWGKSIVIMTLVLRATLLNRKTRTIIAVPQTVIAPGFSRRGKADDLHLKVGRKWFPWLIGYDLCDPRSTNRVRQVVEFLSTKPRTPAGQVLLCTHATLAQTYKLLKRRRKLNLFRDLTIWIDEAHHIKNARIVGQKATVSNTLGALIKYAIKSGCGVGLATATFMRGDERHILPKGTSDLFMRHDIAYDDYLADAETGPVENFQFHVSCDSTFDALAKLFREKRKTILYIAKVNSRYSTGCKYATVDSVLRVLEKQQQTHRKLEGPVIRIGKLRVLDLVTESGRAQRQDFLASNPELDLIIALDTCKEGFDWTHAERSIIVGERKSVVESIQMIGRLFRRHNSQPKERVDVYRIMPPVVVDKTRFKRANDSQLNAVFEGMLLGELFRPMSAMPGKRGPRGPRLHEHFPNTETWFEFQRAFSALAAETLELGGTKKDCFRYAEALCKRFDVPTTVLEGVWRITVNMVREFDKKRGKIIEVYQFADVVEGMVNLHTELLGPTALKDYRKALGLTTRAPEEWVPIAEKLARDNAKGLLKETTTYETLAA